MRLGAVVLESLQQDVLIRVIGVAGPVEEEATFLGTGGLGVGSHLLAEVLDVLGLRTESDINQDHGSEDTQVWWNGASNRSAPVAGGDHSYLAFRAAAGAGF